MHNPKRGTRLSSVFSQSLKPSVLKTLPNSDSNGTHIMLMEKNIKSLEEHIVPSTTTSFVYLNNNQIESLDRLEDVPNVTHLYAQMNLLPEITGLHLAFRLEKINLSFNMISSLRGLENCLNLKEIRLENQRISQPLELDADVLQQIGRSLQFIDISGNKVNDLTNLRHCIGLRSIVATNNDITNVQKVIPVIRSCRYLLSLDITGSPICTKRFAMDTIVAESINLNTLNSKIINPNQREFLIALQMKKLEKAQHSQNESNGASSTSTNESFYSSKNRFHVKSKLENKSNYDVSQPSSIMSPFVQAFSKFS